MRPSALALVLPLFAAVATGAEPPATLDPVAVNATLQRELLVQVVELGLARGRSDREEDLDRIACVRDKRPGTQFVAIRCASNRDWDRLAKLSISRAMVGTTDQGVTSGAACGMLFTTLERARTHRGNADVKDGVLTVNPRMLLDSPTAGLSEPQRMARINELMGLIAANGAADEYDTPPDEVVRFARVLREVEAKDDAAAEAMIQAEGFTLDRYNQLVTQLESGDRFKSRVARAQAAQDPALSF
jgi:hypothetical protein